MTVIIFHHMSLQNHVQYIHVLEAIDDTSIHINADMK